MALQTPCNAFATKNPFPAYFSCQQLFLLFFGKTWAPPDDITARRGVPGIQTALMDRPHYTRAGDTQARGKLTRNQTAEGFPVEPCSPDFLHRFVRASGKRTIGILHSLKKLPLFFQQVKETHYRRSCDPPLPAEFGAGFCFLRKPAPIQFQSSRSLTPKIPATIATGQIFLFSE